MGRDKCIRHIEGLAIPSVRNHDVRLRSENVLVPAPFALQKSPRGKITRGLSITLFHGLTPYIEYSIFLYEYSPLSRITLYSVHLVVPDLHRHPSKGNSVYVLSSNEIREGPPLSFVDSISTPFPVSRARCLPAAVPRLNIPDTRKIFSRLSLPLRLSLPRGSTTDTNKITQRRSRVTF